MSQEYRYILRIMGTDVQGTLKTSYAVAQVKGVSMSLSNAILKKAGVNPDLRVGFLTESDISKIEDVIETQQNIVFQAGFSTGEKTRKQEKMYIF